MYVCRPLTHRGQFYHQLTYWQAAFLMCPESQKKGFKRILVAPSQKVASYISNSHFGKPLFEGPYVCMSVCMYVYVNRGQRATKTGHLLAWASLRLSGPLSASLGISVPLWASASEPPTQPSAQQVPLIFSPSFLAAAGSLQPGMYWRRAFFVIWNPSKKRLPNV